MVAVRKIAANFWKNIKPESATLSCQSGVGLSCTRRAFKKFKARET